MTPLPPDRWPEIERLFLAAADADAPARDALLRATDPAVAAEVRALLDAEPTADAFFTRPGRLGRLLGALAESPPTDTLAPGVRLGPWAVAEEIGRGGMGTVYRARRADGLHTAEAAVKVVSRGMDTAAVLERFAHERALLASLAHPGIARLLDGGTADDGRPYLAMELVDGEPITHWADRHRLGVEARLGLFLQVCEAVAHAHRRLVVHRDLKPSNVLVSPGDGGRPRATLLDFGVAKLLAPDGAATLTGEGPRPFTPEYAAPEQLDGRPVTTATDVYALGGMLHELLAGHRPARSGATGGAVPRPSAAVSVAREHRGHGGETRTVRPDEIAARRAMTPERLGQRLRGDLDAVVIKALRPEPEARYASVDALAEDLRRHLDGRPVLAQQGSGRYVAGKFLRRHRWSAGGAAALLAVAIGFAAVVGVQNRRVVHERDKAREVAALLEGIFLEVDPGGRRGRVPTLLEVLEAGAVRVQALDGNPEVQAHLLDVVARVFRALADYDRALPLQRAAVYRATEAHGPRAPETLLAEHHLAYLYEQMGREAEAERLYRHVLTARRASGDPDGLVESLSDLGGLMLGRGRLAEASALAREGLVVLDRHPDAGPLDLEGPLSRASFLTTLGRSHEEAGQLADAERLLREVLAICVRERGPSHVYTASAETTLARVLSRRGLHDEADRLLRHAVAVQEAVWGPVHPWTVGALLVRGDARQSAGALAEAGVLFDTARRRAASAGDTARAALAERRRAALP